MNLVSNAIKAMLSHPEQLELVRGGEYGWDAVITVTSATIRPKQRIFFASR